LQVLGRNTKKSYLWISKTPILLGIGLGLASNNEVDNIEMEATKGKTLLTFEKTIYDL
jgi:hypothetical protein